MYNCILLYWEKYTLVHCSVLELAEFTAKKKELAEFMLQPLSCGVIFIFYLYSASKKLYFRFFSNGEFFYLLGYLK